MYIYILCVNVYVLVDESSAVCFVFKNRVEERQSAPKPTRCALKERLLPHAMLVTMPLDASGAVSCSEPRWMQS